MAKIRDSSPAAHHAFVSKWFNPQSQAQPHSSQGQRPNHLPVVVTAVIRKIEPFLVSKPSPIQYRPIKPLSRKTLLASWVIFTGIFSRFIQGLPDKHRVLPWRQ